MVAVSLVLAASIALVGHRDHSERYYWAGGLTAQALAYVLFGLRGQIPDWPSIVLGNVLLASSFGLYTTGLMRFRGVRLPRWLVWGPVGITGLLFWVLIDHTSPRLIVSGVLIMIQIGILLTALLIRRQTPLLRGEWLIVSGAMAMAGLMAFRLWAVTSGLLRIQFVTDGGWIQGMTFMFAMTSTLMLAIGLIIMSEERAEASLALGQRFQWYRGQILERLSTGAPLAEVLDAIRQGLEALRPDTQCRIALGDQESGMPPKADDTPWKTRWSQPVVSSTRKVLGHFMLYQEDPRPPHTRGPLIDQAIGHAGGTGPGSGRAGTATPRDRRADAQPGLSRRPDPAAQPSAAAEQPEYGTGNPTSPRHLRWSDVHGPG